MSVKDKLQILLVTYNRKKYLQRTLDEILADSSPVKDFDITILDNASTDGTSELIDEYCKNFPNITHIRHKINIGGNANICRAFEMATSCGKEYLWILCDDDKYDFSNWNEVEKNIKEHKDIICVCDYICNTQEKKLNPAYQIFQLTFVPAGIYKISLIDSDVLINMYDSVITMFQQTVLAAKCINKNKSIHVLSKPICFNGLHFDDRVDDESLSYTRGTKEKWHLERRLNTNWILGFTQILSLFKNTQIQEECMECAISYKDIYGNWNFFYDNLIYFISSGQINYTYEIFQKLSKNRQEKFIEYASPKLSKYLYAQSILEDLKITNKQYNDLELSSIEKIFSVKNTKKQTHKVVTILGVKFKFKRR